eukprot:Hpha_TRINITY_DN17069_c0_g1::TRINITY_DN17069_c0_g1_i1::g.166066::m.166066
MPGSGGLPPLQQPPGGESVTSKPPLPPGRLSGVPSVNGLNRVRRGSNLPTLSTPGSDARLGWRIDWRHGRRRPSAASRPSTVPAQVPGGLSHFTKTANTYVSDCCKLLPDRTGLGDTPKAAKVLASRRRSSDRPRADAFSTVWEEVSSTFQQHLKSKRELEAQLGMGGANGCSPLLSPMTREQSVFLGRSPKKRKREKTPASVALDWTRLGSPTRTEGGGHTSAHEVVNEKIEILRAETEEWQRFQTRVGDLVKVHRGAVGRSHVHANRAGVARSAEEKAARQAVMRDQWYERRDKVTRMQNEEALRLADMQAVLEAEERERELEREGKIEFTPDEEQMCRAWSVAACLLSRVSHWLNAAGPLGCTGDRGKQRRAATRIQRWYRKVRMRLKWRMSKQVAEHIICRFIWGCVQRKRQARRPESINLLTDFLKQYHYVKRVPAHVHSLYRTTVKVQRWLRDGRLVRRARMAMRQLQFDKEVGVRLIKCDKEADRLRTLLVAGADAHAALLRGKPVQVMGHREKGKRTAGGGLKLMNKEEVERVRTELLAVDEEKANLEKIDRDILMEVVLCRLRTVEAKHREVRRDFLRKMAAYEKERAFAHQRFRKQFLSHDVLMDRFRRTVKQARAKRVETGNSWLAVVRQGLARQQSPQTEPIPPKGLGVPESPQKPVGKRGGGAKGVKSPDKRSPLDQQVAGRQVAAAPLDSTIRQDSMVQMQNEEELREQLVDKEITDEYRALDKVGVAPVPPVFPILFTKAQLTEVLQVAAERSHQQIAARVRREHNNRPSLRSDGQPSQAAGLRAEVIVPLDASTRTRAFEGAGRRRAGAVVRRGNPKT